MHYAAYGHSEYIFKHILSRTNMVAYGHSELTFILI